MLIPTVVINRTYLARGKAGDVRPATGQESWESLLGRLRDLGLTPEPFTADDGTDGVTVECPNERGQAGSYTVHTLACNYGALAVIRYRQAADGG